MATRHKPWRTSPLPRGWKRIRRAVLERDNYQCTWHLDHHDGLWTTPDTDLPIPPTATPLHTTPPARCPYPADEVDHIGEADHHSMARLRSICSAHHKRRTAQQAARARNDRAKQAQARAAARERANHPGMKRN